MDKNEFERRLEAAEKQNIGLMDEIKNLKAQLAKVQDEPEIPDFPEFMIGDDYYPHIRWESIPRKCTVDSLNEEYCKKSRTAEMNYFNFHSAEYYHSFESKCKLIAMILHCKWYCDKEVVTDFSDGYSEKWCVWYDHFSEEWSVDSQRTHESTTVYFATEEAAQKCAEWLNEHWKEDGNGI
jgi:hypothetical protein